MSLNKENIEENIFNYLEGNLSGSELEEFKSYINSNADAKSELDFWKQTYVANTATTVSSAEFSSLKKSNKMYYWVSGVAAAFLLGVGTMAVLNTNTTEQNQPQMEAEEIQTTIPQESISNEEIEPIIVEKIEENIINEAPLETSNTQTLKEEVESVEEEAIQEENIELSEQLDVKIEPSETNREAKLKEIKIKKETIVKKKKEVDVIDLETGF